MHEKYDYPEFSIVEARLLLLLLPPSRGCC
jgi:hypothetical protein